MRRGRDVRRWLSRLRLRELRSARSRARDRDWCQALRGVLRTVRVVRLRDFFAYRASRRARTGKPECRAPCPTRSPSSLRKRDAVFHRRVFERNEGHHIRCADAGMLARVLAQVDALRSFADPLERSLNSVFHWHDEGDHRSVMGLVGRCVQNGDAFDGSDSVANRADDFRSPAFGEIGYALYQFHSVNSIQCRRLLALFQQPRVNDGIARDDRPLRNRRVATCGVGDDAACFADEKNPRGDIPRCEH